MIMKRLILLFTAFSLIFTSGLAMIPPVALALEEECSEEQLRNLGITTLNCKGDVDPCSTGASTSGLGVAAGGSVYILGDSITVGTEASYRSQFAAKDITPVINAASSRSWNGGGIGQPTAEGTTNSAAADVAADTGGKIKDAKGIVIALGSNGGVGSNPVETMIDTIRQKNPSAPIWWVNTAGTAAYKPGNPNFLSYLGPFNQKLSDTASAKNFKIIDWFNAVTPGGNPSVSPTSDPGGLLSDGLHPSGAGRTKLAELVTNSISGTGGADAKSSELGSTCCSAGAGSQVAGNNNPEKVWNYLVGTMGFSAVQAAGIMGNIEQESGFNPTIVNKQSGAYGLIQWYAGRETGLENYARSVGKDKGDLGMQLDFMKQELEGPYYKSRVTDPIRATNDLATATRVWLEKYEIPCSPPGRACDKETGVRVPFAQNWLTLFGSNTGNATTNAAAPTCGSAGGTGVGPDGFVFPLKTTKAQIQAGVQGAVWCFDKQSNCHHDYNAADIHVPTGTEVVAARGGEVVYTKTGPSRVVIKGDDGVTYHYTHLGANTLTVAKGQKVVAGAVLGKVGTSQDAAGTAPHLHIDALPGDKFDNRPACAGPSCSGLPFLELQPALVGAYNGLQ